jgi:hypothetical protein
MTVPLAEAPRLIPVDRCYADECGSRSRFLPRARAATHREAALWVRVTQIKARKIKRRPNPSGGKMNKDTKNMAFSNVATTPRMQACMHGGTCKHN